MTIIDLWLTRGSSYFPFANKDGDKQTLHPDSVIWKFVIDSICF